MKIKHTWLALFNTGLVFALLNGCGSSESNTQQQKESGDGNLQWTASTKQQKELSDGSLGSSCGSCQNEFQCIKTASIPNGYCTKTCYSEEDCGSNGACIPESTPICYRQCSKDEDCRPGYACKKLNNSMVCDVGTPANSGGTPTTGGDCNAVALPAQVSGGCKIRLVEPALCQEIDLSGGKTFWFGWSTDTSYCETPFKLIIAGNPPTEQNAYTWSLSEGGSNGKIAKNTGGIKEISAADLQGLTSNNGIYHWVVLGWYGSHPASQTFRLKQ
jgi:hypothetical protein